MTTCTHGFPVEEYCEYCIREHLAALEDMARDTTLYGVTVVDPSAVDKEDK